MSEVKSKVFKELASKAALCANSKYCSFLSLETFGTERPNTLLLATAVCGMV